MSTRKSGKRRKGHSRNGRSSKRLTTNERILFSLAKALNQAEQAKLYPILAHGSIFTNHGYVIPVGRKTKWQVRIPLQNEEVHHG